MIETPEWCVDGRHGAPCPQPPRGDRCEACDDEGCDPVARVAADTAIEAARTAGWSEAYIARLTPIERETPRCPS